MLLENYNSTATSPTSVVLDTAFSELKDVRILRISDMMQLVHAQGQVNVTKGAEVCKARNAGIRALRKDPERNKKCFIV